MDRDLVEAAIFGFERKRNELDLWISSLRNQLEGKGTAVTAAHDRSPKRRTMSAAARARISAAQKKRWAAAKSKQSEKQPRGTTNAPKRRTMSAAARKRISATQRARWAALKAKTGIAGK